MPKLDTIRIVLVNTTHPGNIGATARAMKTMGLQHLYLVKPQLFPDPEATARASGADDILEQAVVVNSLPEAIADCHLVFGTSARARSLPWPVVTAKECAARIAVEPNDQNIAIVFGREKSGLTNEELACCNYHVTIPTDTSYQSLNLGSAVQIIGYELLLITSLEKQHAIGIVDYASHAELENFYEHLEHTLLKIKFIETHTSHSMMKRLRRLFNRTHLEKSEINILRGILKAMDQWIKHT